MAGVSCGLFDNMQDDPAQVGDFVPQGFGVTTPRECRQRGERDHGVGTAALVVVEGEHHLRRSRCCQRGMVIRPRQWFGRSGDDLLEPVPLRVTQMFYEPEGRPAGGQDRRCQCLCVNPVDNGQDAGSLRREERRQRLLLLEAQGKVPIDFGMMWFKGQHMGTGQAPVKSYNRALRDLIAGEKATPSFIVSHQLSLDETPTAYEHFDARDEGWTKVVLHPDGHSNGHKR